MLHPSKTFATCIGCDVGKASIVVHHGAGGQTLRLANQRSEIQAWADRLPPDSLVVCEATGGYEAVLLAVLCEKSVAVHRADARKVKAFIRSLGRHGKTDAIDAKALARYGAERQALLPLWQAREAQRERLHVLVLTRRDLVADRVAYRNRLKAPTAEPARVHIEAVLACLDEQIDRIDTDINTVMQQCDPLSSARKALCSIQGVGGTTAATLIALMPELGQLSRRQAASLAGVAPHPRQSGDRDHYRPVTGGRQDIKRTLFMAALAAARANGPLKTMYQRLTQAGKPKLVALTAIMRKIIVIANARLKACQPKPKTSFELS